MYKIGLKLWSTNADAYLADAQRLYGAGVFDYLELLVVPGSLGTLVRWRRLHDGMGMPFVIHNAHSALGFNLADATALSGNRDIYRETKAFADALEAERVIFHGGVDGTVEETVRQLKGLEEPRALIENKPFLPLPNSRGVARCRGATVSELKVIVSGVGCGFCLDVGHAICSANAQGLGPDSFVRELAKDFQPTMFHLSDVMDLSSPYDAHPHLGAGRLDITGLCRDVFPDGGWISVETVKDSPEGLEDFRRDAEHLRICYNMAREQRLR